MSDVKKIRAPANALADLQPTATLAYQRSHRHLPRFGAARDLVLYCSTYLPRDAVLRPSLTVSLLRLVSCSVRARPSPRGSPPTSGAPLFGFGAWMIARPLPAGGHVTHVL